MQDKVWKIVNSNLVSVIISAGGAAFFAHWFTKSYREQELKLLAKRNDELEQDCSLYRRDNYQLLSTNARVVSEYTILKNRFDDCRHQFDYSWCFWRASNHYDNKQNTTLTNSVVASNQPNMRN
jgi:hypothetical protein